MIFAFEKCLLSFTEVKERILLFLSLQFHSCFSILMHALLEGFCFLIFLLLIFDASIFVYLYSLTNFLFFDVEYYCSFFKKAVVFNKLRNNQQVGVIFSDSNHSLNVNGSVLVIPSNFVVHIRLMQVVVSQDLMNLRFFFFFWIVFGRFIFKSFFRLMLSFSFFCFYILVSLFLIIVYIKLYLN